MKENEIGGQVARKGEIRKHINNFVEENENGETTQKTLDVAGEK